MVPLFVIVNGDEKLSQKIAAENGKRTSQLSARVMPKEGDGQGQYAHRHGSDFLKNRPQPAATRSDSLLREFPVKDNVGIPKL